MSEQFMVNIKNSAIKVNIFLDNIIQSSENSLIRRHYIKLHLVGIEVLQK